MKIRDLQRTAEDARRALEAGIRIQIAETQIMALTELSDEEVQALVGDCVHAALNDAVEAAKRSAHD